MAFSSSNHVKTNKHLTLQTLKLFVAVTRLTCAFVPVKPLSSKPYWHFTESSELHQTANRTSQSNQGLLADLALSSPEVSSSYSDDYLSSWKMRITRYPSCFVHS
jgi:hypothetical protein